MFADYENLEIAYNFYNKNLFEGKLDGVIFTMARKKNQIGVFRPIAFCGRGAEDTPESMQEAAEIGFNPDYLDRTIPLILSTLVHEMCHKAQYQYGDPGRVAYHNKEWAAMMEALGLMPSSTGEEGGKRTGQKVSHYIIDGGVFDIHTKKLLESDFGLRWQGILASTDLDIEKPKAKRKKSKLKYTCPECQQNAWAKPETPLMCGRCRVDMVCEEVDA